MNLRSAVLFVLCFFALNAPAQKRLDISLDNQCIFSGGYMETPIYTFEPSERVQEWVDEILDNCGETQNFELIDGSVENVTAVVDGQRRVILYSVDFIIKNPSPLQVYAALAHEIGHHVNLHTLKPENRLKEEWEADVFTGFFLSKKDYRAEHLDSGLFRAIPSSYENADRRNAMLEGLRRAQNATIAKSLGVDSDPEAKKLLLPTFNFEKCYATCDIPRSTFAGRTSLAKVDEKIRLVLDTRGYYNRSYFSVPGGFAVVTQMEQYNREDATIRKDRTRWLDYPANDNFSGLLGKLAGLFVQNNGYFRLFVLVVMDQPFTASDKQISKKEASAWLNQGANRLPKEIGQLAFGTDHVVSAMVYEFEVPESTHKPKQICPTPLHAALEHLKQSGLGAGLGIK